MRFLVAISILVFLQATPAKKNPAPDQQRTQSLSDQSKNKPAVKSKGDSQTRVVVEKLPEKDVWDKFYIILTGLLVVTGIVTLAAVWYQAVQTKNATRAMERSSGITVEIERGRIVIFWGQMIHMDLSPTGVHDGRLEHCFNWSCLNTGRTPAQLTAVWSRFVAVDKLSDLPEKPLYDPAKEKPYDGEPLEPHAKERQTIWFSTPLETALSFEDMQNRSRSGQCFLYAYGYARYKDIWGNPHITRFGLVRFITGSLLEDNWMVGGPPAFNQSE